MGEVKPPVKVGDVLKLGVTNFGKDGGDPMMVLKGFVIFLKDPEKKAIQLNTLIEIRITKVLPRIAFAERTNGN